MVSSSPRRRFYGWYVVAVAAPIYLFANGLVLFVPQNLFPRYMETFDATAGQVSLSTAITLGVVALMAPFSGALIDRLGVMRVLRVGLLIMAATVSIYPFAQSLHQMYALHAVMALGMVMTGLPACVVLLCNWFVTRRGAVVGLLVAGASLGGAILPLAISPLVNNPALGWRWGYGSLSAAYWLLAVLPAYLFLKESPASVGQFPDGLDKPPAAAGERELRVGVPFREALRSRTLWCLALGSACLWFAFQAVNSQITIFAELEAGVSASHATKLYAMIFAFSVVGKFTFGTLSDYLVKRHVMLITSAILLAACLLLFEFADGISLTYSYRRLLVFAMVFGLGYGGCYTMVQLVCVESFGQLALGKILGVVITADALAAAVGTALPGYLRTLTGSYLLSFSIVTGVAVVAIINVLFIRPLPFRVEAPVDGQAGSF